MQFSGEVQLYSADSPAAVILCRYSLQFTCPFIRRSVGDKHILNPGLGRRRSARQSWHPTSNRRTGRDRRPSFPTNALPWIPSWMVEYAQSPTSSCRGHRWWQWVQSRKGSGRWLGRHRHKGCSPRSSALRRIRRCPRIAASSPTTFLVQKKTSSKRLSGTNGSHLQSASCFESSGNGTSNLGSGFTPTMEEDHRNIQRQIMNSTKQSSQCSWSSQILPTCSKLKCSVLYIVRVFQYAMCIYCKQTKHCPVRRRWVQQFTTPGRHHKSSCASPRWCDRPPCRWWSGPMPRWKHKQSNREACSTPGLDGCCANAKVTTASVKASCHSLVNQSKVKNRMCVSVQTYKQLWIWWTQLALTGTCSTLEGVLLVILKTWKN